MKRMKKPLSLLISLLLILSVSAGPSLAVSSGSGRMAEEAPTYLYLTTGGTTVITVDGTQEIDVCTGTDVVSAEIRHYSTEADVPYAAVASSSQNPCVIAGVPYSADLVLDRDETTYYLSEGHQKSGDWVMVDLGTAIEFGAVQVTSFKGNFCTGAHVQISPDGSRWTDIGIHSGNGNQNKTTLHTVPSSLEAIRYIRVLLSADALMSWNLAEISWGSSFHQSFVPYPVSGTVSLGSQPKTQITFSGVSAGKATYIIGGTTYVITVSDAVHEHQWQTVYEAPASCTEDGSRTRTCTVCGRSETESIPAPGHDYQALITAPTCTEGGYTSHTCSRCGDSYTDSETNPLGHRWGAWTVSAPSTCTGSGTQTRVCLNDPSHTQSHAVPALGHDYQAVITAPTCTEGGYTSHTCSRCGDSYADSETPASGHAWGEWKTVTEPTCTQKGSAVRICANDSAHSESKELPAFGHDYVIQVVAPTCTESGYTDHTCTRCGSVYTDSYTAATGHAWSNWQAVTSAGCESDGLEQRVCGHDASHTETRTLPATGHAWGEWAAVTEPTCEKNGLDIRVCANDASHTETRETAAVGHNYEPEVVAPTCTTDGYTRFTCSRCGDHYDAYSSFALGHDYVTEKVEATCTEGGYRVHTCMRCGTAYKDSVTPPLGHQYLDSITEPTCTEPGFTAHTCVRCGAGYTDTPTEAVGHDWGKWQMAAEPTCTVAGSRIRVCSRNHEHRETEVIPAAGHEYHETVVAPTCTEEGYALHSCARCGDSFRDNTVPALGHRYHQVSAEYPTEHTYGSLLVTCETCSGSSRISLPFVNSENYDFSSADACYVWQNTSYGEVRFSLPGDVNGDGTVGLADVSLLFRWTAGRAELTDAALARGNMDGSSATDLKDVARIFRWYSSFD
ncbi:MAG: discoidin domain-containing protein [Oscillospiraceae bacterium]|nr:discoidin domain-containing protein [Oscillospiraceae bacterium]